jgi:hypothetical protein
MTTAADSAERRCSRTVTRFHSDRSRSDHEDPHRCTFPLERGTPHAPERALAEAGWVPRLCQALRKEGQTIGRVTEEEQQPRRGAVLPDAVAQEKQEDRRHVLRLVGEQLPGLLDDDRRLRRIRPVRRVGMDAGLAPLGVGLSLAPSGRVLTLFALRAILLGGTRIPQWIYPRGSAGPRPSRYRAADAARSTIGAG